MEKDAEICPPGKIAFTQSQRAENYRRVAECMATRVSRRNFFGFMSSDGDPCPRALGSGWHLPSKADLLGLTAPQRRNLTDAWRTANDGFFSSLVVVARDDDRLFALDVAPNGRSKYLRSKFSDGYGFHTARCVRAPGPYRPAPPLSIEARECVEIQKTGAKTWMERRAAEGKASPPLYPEVVAFRDMADRLRTQPDLDVRTIRKELDTLKPTLSRIRTFFQNLNALQGRIDLANFQLKESRAEQNNAQGATAPKQDMEERIRAKETELEQLRSAIDEDHGEYRNFEALREGFDWVSSSVNEYLPQLVVAERALRVKGRNAPDAWRTRRAELIELEHYMGDLKSEITGNED